jgi:hypothetical protein
MIEMRRKQLSFGDGLIAGEVSDLRENWMPHADEVLADEEIVAIVYEAMAKRHPRAAVAAAVVLRPRPCCGCWFSSTSATGATRRLNARFGPIWCTGTLPA